jgi:hypothetical protein
MALDGANQLEELHGAHQERLAGLGAAPIGGLASCWAYTCVRGCRQAEGLTQADEGLGTVWQAWAGSGATTVGCLGGVGTGPGGPGRPGWGEPGDSEGSPESGRVGLAMPATGRAGWRGRA